MYSSIHLYCQQLSKEFDIIPQPRKEILEKISAYVNARLNQNKPANLVYICTHNSRRSHFGQIWARVAVSYFGLAEVYSYSGGTEATAFNINAIHALKRIGFTINPANADKNTHYQVFYDEHEEPVESYSKIYDDAKNPQREFAAIMTCGEAEENCPFIPGADLRIATTYDDPKVFDNTPQQDQKYDERCRQIALETFYVFSKVISQ